MRTTIALLLAVLYAAPARAQEIPPPDGSPAPPARPAPPPEPPWWKNYSPPPQEGGMRVPVAATGGAIAGVGVLALFGAGVAAIVAAANARDLDDECPSYKCSAGSMGARNLEDARDAAGAAEILAAIGLPAVAGGLTMVAIGVAAGRRYSGKIAVGPGGVRVQGEF
jgi:hypothetical protein